MTDRELIEADLDHRGITALEWREGEDGIEAVCCGEPGTERWTCIADNDDQGLFSGDKGVLTAVVVGARQHHNQRVSYGFTPDGTDAPLDAVPFEDVEPA